MGHCVAQAQLGPSEVTLGYRSGDPGVIGLERESFDVAYLPHASPPSLLVL